MRATRPRSLLAAALIAALLPSCIFSIGGGGKESRTRWAWEESESTTAQAGAEAGATKSKGAAGAAKDGSGAGSDPSKRERELAKKRRDLAHAELELEIAESKAAEQRDGAEQEFEKAAHSLGQAQRELATFLAEVLPQALAKGELEVERAVFRVEQRRQDLQQLVDDYAAHGEEFYAKRTGEIVVWRTSRELELSDAALVQQRAALALERDHELPKKQRALEFALTQAQAGLAQAEAKRKRARTEAHLSLEKARAKLTDLQEELERMERGEGAGAGSEQAQADQG